MSEQEKCKRKIWSREETQGFLYCYTAHRDEFYHSRKKKFAYANVLKDMIAQGFTSSSTTTTALEGKMRTLLMAYKSAKNNGNTTPCIAPFMDAMEEIYGDSPIFCNSLTYNMNMDPTTSQTTHTDTSDEDKSQISLQLQQWPESTDEEILPTAVLLHPKSESENTNEKMSEMKRKVWSREETLGFLYCYHARKDEFFHSRKKKYGYVNVLKDMIAQGFTSPSTTTTALENKMRTLLGLYRTAKDNPNATDASTGIAPFMTEMEEIFGERSTLSDNHTIHMRTVPKTAHIDSSDEDRLQTSSQMEESFVHSPILSHIHMKTVPITTKTAQNDYSDQDQLQNSSQFQQWHQPESVGEEQLLTPTIHLSSLSDLPNPDPLSSITFRKRKSAQEIFFENKLKLKREEMESKKLMREAKHTQRENFMRESLNALQNKWEKDHEVDMKKLELLEKLVKK